MVKIALDPTPFHATPGLLDFPDVAAEARPTSTCN